MPDTNLPVPPLDEGTEGSEYRSWWLRMSFFVAAVGLLVGLVTAAFEIADQIHSPVRPGATPSDYWHARKIFEVILVSSWIVFPPIWFWIDYFGIYLQKKPERRRSLELFKYGQDVSSKIWIAVSTVLFILFFGKDIKP